MNAVERFFLNLLVGLPIVFVGTVVLSGGVDRAGMVFLASVICTAGLGLLFWLPLCWFAGWLSVAIVTAIAAPGWAANETDIARAAARGKGTSRRNDLAAICRYVRACQTQGMSAQQINATLLDCGWSDAVIEQAWEQLRAWE